MKVAGIIAEYNPVHEGHAYHIAQTREMGATHIVSVMSGHTVQRGEFAIASKRARAQAALENGVDLVLCLPTPWSCARAQDFAKGGIHLLQALGCVDSLSFGSECGNRSLIQRAASLLRMPELQLSLHQRVGEGRPFAAARQAALAEIDPEVSQVLGRPNDTLGVEYLQAMKALGANFELFVVKRKGAGHDQPGTVFPSARELRIIIRGSNTTSHNIPCAYLLEAEIAKGCAPVDMSRLEIAWLACLRCLTPEALAALPDVSEGLEHRLYAAIRQAGSVAEILSIAGSRRYPTARLRRILFHALLGVTAAELGTLPRFIQVIGHNAAGRELLRKAKTQAVLPILHRMADAKSLDATGLQQFMLECSATDLMSLAMPHPQPCGSEERRKIIAL